MSPSLPPEIYDLVIDHLHDEPTTLKVCCLVSKSWIPRTRSYLFAHVKFDCLKSPVERWKKIFPDPTSSPAHHARTLSIWGMPVVTTMDSDVGGWIPTFHSVVHLRLDCLTGKDDHWASLVPFYRLSPTVRSLCLASTHSEAFGLICSFPLLEGLALHHVIIDSDADEWNPPFTSPKLTGSLDLRMPPNSGSRSIVRRLLGLPGGLRFTKITVACFDEDAEQTLGLISGCSDTLESLNVYYYQGEFPSTVNGQYLTTARVRSCTIARPLQGHKTQRPDVSVGKSKRSVDHYFPPIR